VERCPFFSNGARASSLRLRVTFISSAASSATFVAGPAKACKLEKRLTLALGTRMLFAVFGLVLFPVNHFQVGHAIVERVPVSVVYVFSVSFSDQPQAHEQCAVSRALETREAVPLGLQCVHDSIVLRHYFVEEQTRDKEAKSSFLGVAS